MDPDIECDIGGGSPPGARYAVVLGVRRACVICIEPAVVLYGVSVTACLRFDDFRGFDILLLLSPRHEP